jgi:hypothetical protein
MANRIPTVYVARPALAVTEDGARLRPWMLSGKTKVWTSNDAFALRASGDIELVDGDWMDSATGETARALEGADAMELFAAGARPKASTKAGRGRRF